jgi:hypothetical protein
MQVDETNRVLDPPSTDPPGYHIPAGHGGNSGIGLRSSGGEGRDTNSGGPIGSGGQNDDFRPLTSTLGGRGMRCRDKYVTS